MEQTKVYSRLGDKVGQLTTETKKFALIGNSVYYKVTWSDGSFTWVNRDFVNILENGDWQIK